MARRFQRHRRTSLLNGNGRGYPADDSPLPITAWAGSGNQGPPVKYKPEAESPHAQESPRGQFSKTGPQRN